MNDVYAILVTTKFSKDFEATGINNEVFRELAGAIEAIQKKDKDAKMVNPTTWKSPQSSYTIIKVKLV